MYCFKTQEMMYKYVTLENILANSLGSKYPKRGFISSVNRIQTIFTKIFFDVDYF